VMLTRGHKPAATIQPAPPAPVAHEAPAPPAEELAAAPKPADVHEKPAVVAHAKTPSPAVHDKAPAPLVHEPKPAPVKAARPVAAVHEPAAKTPAEPHAAVPKERKVSVASAEHVAAASPTPRGRGGLPSEEEQKQARDAYARGNTQLFQGHADQAIEAFKESLRLDGRNPAVQRGLGLAYGQTGNATQAVSYLKRYLKMSPAATDRALIEKRIEQLSAH
jgi:tetratricopeptide (TPR) repeat protein